MMKPALIALLLLSTTVSGVVHAAQWRKVSAAQGDVFYIDTRIVKKGKTRKVWSLHNGSKAQQMPERKPNRSSKAPQL